MTRLFPVLAVNSSIVWRAVPASQAGLPAWCPGKSLAALTERPRLCGGQESKRNQLKDFVNIAGPLGVTHFLILTATETAAYLRVAKTPQVRRRV